MLKSEHLKVKSIHSLLLLHSTLKVKLFCSADEDEQLNITIGVN